MVERGETTIAEADEDQREFALIKAADYLEQKYRLLWKGSRAQSTQRMSWPRRGVDVPDFFDPFYRDLSNIPLSFQDTWLSTPFGEPASAAFLPVIPSTAMS